jgi:hypothetical protein
MGRVLAKMRCRRCYRIHEFKFPRTYNVNSRAFISSNHTFMLSNLFVEEELFKATYSYGKNQKLCEQHGCNGKIV